jgi:signal transduction histidine kinase
VVIGAIEVDLPADDVGAAQRRVLDELAAPAGLALSTVRLTVDLRRHVAELERANTALRASRDRLRTARRDERRRLRSEVDHHVVRHLTDAVRALGAAPAPADARGVAAFHCEQALDELRLIARGIYPSRLGEAGLLVSLDGWLERARTHADITSDGELRALHENPELEACMYFCAVTALDALATAGASALAAVIAERNAVVTLEVSGTGGAEPAGDALTALRDRIEAFDGELTTMPTELLFRAPLRPVAAHRATSATEATP